MDKVNLTFFFFESKKQFAVYIWSISYGDLFSTFTVMILKKLHELLSQFLSYTKEVARNDSVSASHVIA